MEYEKIKELMQDMSNSKLSSMDIEFEDGTKISMQKNNSEEVVAVRPQEEIKEEIVPLKGDEKYIVSPMVGTFYLKPSPTSEPFVTVGSSIKKGDTVCIVEAMKLMNEIESDYDGTIKEILVNDGTPVEYGTKLFKIE